MTPENKQQLKEAGLALLDWLNYAFDRIADWVTQQTWKRLGIYAIVALIAGGILQDTLFSGGSDEFTITEPKKRVSKVDSVRLEVNKDGIKVTPNEEASSNSSTKNDDDADNRDDEKDDAEAEPPAPAAPAAPAALPALPAPAANPAAPTAPVPAVPALTQKEIDKLLKQAQRSAEQAAKSASIAKQAAQEANDRLALANTDVQEKVVRYRKQTSRWFMNFVILAIIGLFATKAMMGGKKRAEAQTEQARANAEREALQRQVSEAKMQMMQAQVEPHFLFNTLASVEHLIETDPPRAAAMQRSLIKYLRAVLPQMRENTLLINLGREVDLVQAYLDLLKMRMEERLNVVLEIPENLRTAAFPPMMLQSLAENAIKHGLECKAEGGTLLIKAELLDNILRVSVTDDGMGFGVVKSDSTGLGLTSIRERLKLLHGGSARLLIEPNQPNGVCATIEVPYEEAKMTPQ